MISYLNSGLEGTVMRNLVAVAVDPDGEVIGDWEACAKIRYVYAEEPSETESEIVQETEWEIEGGFLDVSGAIFSYVTSRTIEPVPRRLPGEDWVFLRAPHAPPDWAEWCRECEEKAGHSDLCLVYALLGRVRPNLVGLGREQHVVGDPESVIRLRFVYETEPSEADLAAQEEILATFRAVSAVAYDLRITRLIDPAPKYLSFERWTFLRAAE